MLKIIHSISNSDQGNIISYASFSSKRSLATYNWLKTRRRRVEGRKGKEERVTKSGLWKCSACDLSNCLLPTYRPQSFITSKEDRSMSTFLCSTKDVHFRSANLPEVKPLSSLFVLSFFHFIWPRVLQWTHFTLPIFKRRETLNNRLNWRPIIQSFQDDAVFITQS